MNERQRTFSFVHSASTTGSERNDEFICIVAASNKWMERNFRRRGAQLI
ncbi:hypothetical protein [Pseudomonas bharatica]